MCIYKDCPIYEKCEKEIEQVLYCRHVEMIKKLAKMRSELRKQAAQSKMLQEGAPKTAAKSALTSDSAKDRTLDATRPVYGLRNQIN